MYCGCSCRSLAATWAWGIVEWEQRAQALLSRTAGASGRLLTRRAQVYLNQWCCSGSQHCGAEGGGPGDADQDPECQPGAGQWLPGGCGEVCGRGFQAACCALRQRGSSGCPAFPLRMTPVCITQGSEVWSIVACILHKHFWSWVLVYLNMRKKRNGHAGRSEDSGTGEVESGIWGQDSGFQVSGHHLTPEAS